MIEELINNKNRLIEIKSRQELDIKLLSKLVNVPIGTLMEWHNWYKIEEKWYYFKPSQSVYFLFNELIGEQLAKHFEVDTVHYELAFCKRKHIPYIYHSDKYNYGIISENFREKDKEYFLSVDLKIPVQASNISNLKSRKVKKIFLDEDNYNAVKRKLIRMTILDFYMNQSDRRSCNFCFSKDKNNYIDLCKLYDYEHSFRYVSDKYRNAILELDLKNSKTLKYIRNQVDMQEQLYKLLDINIKKIIDEITSYYEIEMPQDVQDIYIDNDKQMKRMVKESKLLK